MNINAKATELNTLEIATVSGGAYGDGCPPTKDGLPHSPADRHKGETPAQSLWRAIKEVFLGGGHC